MRKSTIFSSDNLRRQIFKTLGLGIAGLFSFSVANAQLAAGNYFINGNSPTSGNSYQSFSAFFSALSSAGNAISSPGILLKVVPQSGGYNEQFTIPSISGLGPCGTSCEARLIIQGDGTADTKVHFAANNGTSSYSVILVESNYITLDSLVVENTATSGYNFGVKLWKGAHYFTGTNTTFKSRNNGYSSGYSYSLVSSDAATFPSGDPTNANNIHLDNCVFDGGYYGIYLYGGSSSSGTWPANNTIENCTFQNWYYYGLYTRYEDQMVIDRNSFDGSGSGVQYDYATYISYTNNSVVTNNVFDNVGAYALRIYYCNYYNTVSGQFIVANNSVHGNFKYTYGYGMYFYRGSNFEVAYNSVWLKGSSLATGYGMYCTYLTGTNNNFRNNAIQNDASSTRYAHYDFTSATSYGTYDNNTWFNESNASMVYYFKGSQYTGLSAFQSGSSTNGNSQEASPSFVAVNDLHVNGANLYNMGVPIPGVTVDFDGTTRSATTPSHGIHEFTPPANDAGAANFTQPVAQCADTNELIVTVKNYGTNVLTSVIVDWSWTGNGSTSGSGTETLTGMNIATGGDTTILLSSNVVMTSGAPGYNFRAYTSLPNGVTDESFDNDTLDFYTQTAMEGAFTIGGTSPDFATFTDAVVGLETFGVCGAVTFYARGGTYTERAEIKDLQGVSAVNTVMFTTDTNNTSPVKIEFASSSSSNAGVFVLDGTSFVTIDGYDIENTGGSFADVVVIKGNAHDITLSNNTIWNGSTSFNSRPLYVYTQNNDGENIHVMNNDVSGGYYCAYFYGYNGSGPGLDGLVIEGNSFSNAYYYGLYASQFKNASIIGNNVDQVGGSSYVNSYGMMLYGYGSGYEISHNRVHAGYYGMYCYSLSGTNQEYGTFANNKVMIGDTSLGITNGYYALYFSQSGFFNIDYNLVLSQTTNGYSVYLNGGLNKVHNNIFGRVNSGTTMFISGSYTVTDMDHNAYYLTNGATGGLSYAQGLGFDPNGVEVATLYDNLDSLFTCNDTLVGAGTPLAHNLVDIDYGIRSTTAPTIGPHEYISPDGFSLGDDQAICDGDTLYLGSSIAGSTYLWNTGDTTGIIMVSSPGTYSVDIVTGCGAADDEITVVDGSAIPDFIPDSSWLTITFNNTSQFANTYMWDFGDGTTSTDEHPVHLYAAAGTYNVCLTATGECDSDVTCQEVRAWDGTGVGEFDANNAISIYPNPASDVLTVETDGVPGNVLSIEISNISGQVVMTSQLNDFNGYSKEQLDISELTKGVYFVKIFTNEVTTAKRLVVNK